jgi:hypothetical protein
VPALFVHVQASLVTRQIETSNYSEMTRYSSIN